MLVLRRVEQGGASSAAVMADKPTRTAVTVPPRVRPQHATVRTASSSVPERTFAVRAFERRRSCEDRSRAVDARSGGRRTGAVRAGGVEAGEGAVEDVALLGLVDGQHAGGGAGGLLAADPPDGVRVLVGLVEPALDVVPGAHVLGLLLQPDDLVGVRVPRQHVGHLGVGPRVQLLDPGDGHRSAAPVALGLGLDRHLARGEHDPPDRLRIGHAQVVEDLLERAVHQRPRSASGRSWPAGRTWA